MEKNFLTTYRNAIDWLNPNLILCDDIAEVDPSVFENARFNWSNTKDAETGEVVDDDFEGRTYESQVEVMQWFLTSLSEFDVKFLEEHFEGMLFTYSEKLGLYVLCVDFWGTPWDYVPVYTDLEYAASEIGE